MKIQAASASEYQAHMTLVTDHYPKAIARAHNIALESADELAKKQTVDGLTQGQHTPGNYFYVLLEGETLLGYLWLKDFNGTYLCVFDLYILDGFRGQGYGSQAMKWVKTKAKALKCQSVWLHVFGFNEQAIRFYQRCGYGVVDVNMRLDV